MFFSRIRQRMNPKRKKHLYQIPYQLEPPMKRFKRAEVQEVIRSLNPKKASSYELVTGKILKELPITGIKYLAQVLSAVLLKVYFQAEWKVAPTGHPPLEARKTF
jgi:hypothetical protein